MVGNLKLGIKDNGFEQPAPTYPPAPCLHGVTEITPEEALTLDSFCCHATSVAVLIWQKVSDGFPNINLLCDKFDLILSSCHLSVPQHVECSKN